MLIFNVVITISFSLFNTKGILNFKRNIILHLIDYLTIFIFTNVNPCFGKGVIGNPMLTLYILKLLQNAFMGDQSKKSVKIGFWFCITQSEIRDINGIAMKI